MREIRNEQLQISAYHDQLPNGLDVFVIKKDGYKQTYAMFSTDYGSIDREFVVPGEKDATVVPDGIAHFLEHKMFEQENGEDVFKSFARYGASANAFTSFDMTTYLFSSTAHVPENLNILLDYVQDPYFTEENVEKEKGIIGQEIRMYDDDAGWQVFFNLLKGLYINHPLNIDIAGTVESIAEITKDTLYKCYNTFYHPSNMSVVITGDLDPEEICNIVRENQAKKGYERQPDIQRDLPNEPDHIASPRTEVQMAVSIPKLQFGYKDVKSVGLTGRELLVNEYATAVGLEALIGKSSPLFNTLYEQALVDKSFGWSYEVGVSFAYSAFGGNTKDPDRVLEITEEAFAKAVQDGLPEEDFKRARAKMIGQALGEIDNPRALCRSFTSYHFKGANYFDVVSVLESLTHEQVNERLRAHLVPELRSISIISPKK
ncbi:MAG: pitrilysin family protein [Tumebacillaceae bacterium]